MVFRIRLNNIDWYREQPSTLDPPLPVVSQAEGPSEVPIIRVYGTAVNGDKVCAHIHGAFPYLYVEYPGPYKNHGPDQEFSVESAEKWIRKLRRTIDLAMHVSMARRRPTEEGRVHQYVASIALIKAIPFYGYHVGWKLFCKIYLFDPRHTNRLARLLVNGIILKRKLQPYEAHIGYTHQFMIDYNLYGCNFIDVDEANVRFRKIHNDYIDEDREDELPEGIDPESMLPQGLFPSQAYTGWEVDIQVRHILNEREIVERKLHHDFDERHAPVDPDAKFVHSLEELWRLHGNQMGHLIDGYDRPFSISSATREVRPEWLQEAEYRQRIAEIIRHEKWLNPKLDAEKDLPQTVPGEGCIPTAFESVDYLSSFYDTVQVPIPDRWDNASDAGDLEMDISAMQNFEGYGMGPEDYTDMEEDLEEEEEGRTEARQRAEQEALDAELDDDAIDEGEKCAMQTETVQVVDERRGHGEVHDPNTLNVMDIEDIGVTLGPGWQSPKPSPMASTQLGIVHLDDEHADSRDPLDQPANYQQCSSQRRPSEVAVHTPNHGQSTAKTPTSIATDGRLDEELYSQMDWTPTSAVATPGLPKPAPSESQTAMTQLTDTHLASVSVKTSKVHFIEDNENPGPSKRIDLGTGGHSLALSPRKQFAEFTSPSLALTPKKTPLGGLSHEPLTPSELANSIRLAFKLRSNCCILCYENFPPSAVEIKSSISELESVLHQDPYYGDPKDVPENAHEYGGIEHKISSLDPLNLPIFNPMNETWATADLFTNLSPPSSLFWALAEGPPEREDVIRSDAAKTAVLEAGNLSMADSTRPARKAPSQIEGPTQKNKHGFKYSQHKKPVSKRQASSDMSILSLEIHINTRGSLVPDPLVDPIACIFWSIQSAEGGEVDTGIIAVGDEDSTTRLRQLCQGHIRVEVTETGLINALIDMVRDLDPDILTGYEVHSSSWGYIIERAALLNGERSSLLTGGAEMLRTLGTRLTEDLSRVKIHGGGRAGKDVDRWGYNKAAAIRVVGRHFINIWRAMKGELGLLGYKLENVVFHLLNRRIPHYSYQDLTRWYQSGKRGDLNKTLKYFLLRVKLNLEILDKQDYITRISEQARLIGVDFYQVLSRGSQLKVESLLFRISKPESFLLVSPDKKQVARQNAIECKPLIMEPQSAFYTSPVVVLDFQSLYPSVMIAHNYCYSTCLGRIADAKKGSKLGFTDYYRPPGLLGFCSEDVNVAPNGLVYVKSEFRRSLLAKMLAEILDTRVMVKRRMKDSDVSKALHKRLNSWQLALKLIANVTYGYTSATFSGRMPCVEIADSIVQTGRETLEKAIDLIHSEESWGAEVVYGDTDSLFVHLKGKSKDEAFDIGEAIAARVTAMNPKPIKLKFEKVYHPCILMAMKRYVGFKYEHRTQGEPDFDAKGIETVRRDGTPAMQKIVETALKILFRTKDISQVKTYCVRQWTKIMKEKVSIQDFCFAKEVKLGTYKEGAPPQPGVKLAAERMEKDPRNEPQYGERYPYVVVAGAPDQSITDRSVEVEWLLHSDRLALDSSYYIRRKLIPPLERIFNLVGANVMQWYQQMPKYQPLRKIIRQHECHEEEEIRAATLEMFMDQNSNSCPICRDSETNGQTICENCSNERDRSLYEVRRLLQDVEIRYSNLQTICRSCSGSTWFEEVPCNSTDCPVYYSRVREATKLRSQTEAALPILRALESSPSTRSRQPTPMF